MVATLAALAVTVATLTATPSALPEPRPIISRLAVPWGVAFVKPGVAVATERDRGSVLLLRRTPQGWRARVLDQVDAVNTGGGETGLQGIALRPGAGRRPTQVYVYVTTRTDNRVLRTGLRRQEGRWQLGRWRPVITGIPKGSIHNGGRLIFGPDGNLYVSTGETGQGALAQQTASVAGKILRTTPSGESVPGNLRPGSLVFSLGHRNVEGLAFDGAGRLWASELGQDAWDELNLIKRGGNYGWPLVEGDGPAPQVSNYQPPLRVWRTDVGSPAGLAWTPRTGTDRGVLWMAALRGERLWRIPVSGQSTGRPTAHFVGRFGRLRAVTATPSGKLWFASSNRDGRGSATKLDDRIYQLAVD